MTAGPYIAVTNFYSDRFNNSGWFASGGLYFASLFDCNRKVEMPVAPPAYYPAPMPTTDPQPMPACPPGTPPPPPAAPTPTAAPM